MTGTPDGKPLAPAPEIGVAAAQPAAAQPAVPAYPPRLVVMLPGEIDITRDGQIHDTLVLDGDIDEDTYPALIGALSRIHRGDAIPRGDAGLHVDLSAVTFCDLAGLRAIVGLAGAGTPVILHGVPSTLRTVMKILGWDQEPGLVISTCQDGMPDRGAPGPDRPAPRSAHLA